MDADEALIAAWNLDEADDPRGAAAELERLLPVLVASNYAERGVEGTWRFTERGAERAVRLDSQERGEGLVEIGSDAAAFILHRGGRVYLWSDGAGMKRVRLHPPERVVPWREILVGDVVLLVDPAIAPGDEWVIVLRRFPRRHVDVLWGGGEGYTPT